MTRDIDQFLLELESFTLSQLIYEVSHIVTWGMQEGKRRQQIRRDHAAAAIAGHYIATYREELLRQDEERVRLGNSVTAVHKAIAQEPMDDSPERRSLVAESDLLASQYYARFHMMSIVTSMLRRLILRTAAPFSCSGKLASRHLEALSSYEQLRDNFEHFDERLPGREHEDWMAREEVFDGKFRIFMRLPDAGQGRVELNGVEMEFSTREVEKIIAALDDLVLQVRSAVFRDLKKHLRRNPEDLPGEAAPRKYFEHRLTPIG